MYVFLSVGRSFCLSVLLFLCFFRCLSLHLSICLSLCLSFYLSFYLFTIFFNVWLHFCRSTLLYFCLSCLNISVVLVLFCFVNTLSFWKIVNKLPGVYINLVVSEILTGNLLVLLLVVLSPAYIRTDLTDPIKMFHSQCQYWTFSTILYQT